MRHAIVFPVWEYNGVSHFFLTSRPISLRYSMAFQ